MSISGSKFQNLVENAIDVIYTTDKHGIVKYINQRAKNFFNVSLKDIQGKLIADFLKKLPLIDKKQQLNRIMASFMQAMVEKRNEYNYFVELFDETEKHFHINCRLIWDPKKDYLLGSEGIIRDVTEIHQLQVQLEEAKPKFSNLINNFPDLVVKIDNYGKFLYFSPLAVEIFGYQPEEILGKNIFDFFHPEDVQNVANILKETIISNAILSHELRIRHKKGNYLHVSTRLNLMKQNGETRFVGIIIDITKPKMTEVSLQKSDLNLKECIKDLIKNQMNMILSKK